MEFVAIDVETANADMASICQIGMARFVNGVIAKEWKTYVDPQDSFDGINISIHGIDESMVAGAPTFGALTTAIKKELDGRIVVAHTAFDKVAIYQAGAKCGSTPPSCSWLDTACVARRAWKQFSRSGYGLQNVCASIGYKFQPHDALEDAKAAGNVLLAAMTQTGLDLNAWLTRVRQPIDPSLEQRIARQGNPDGGLYGEVLVFTGSLSIQRRDAADLAASVGCQVDSGVTTRTTILVVGDQDLQRLVGHEKSSKHRKADVLIKGGQPIRILRETDFRELVKLSVGESQESRGLVVEDLDPGFRSQTPVFHIDAKTSRIGPFVTSSRLAAAPLTTAAQHIALLVESVKQLKRDSNYVEAERLLLEECDRQEAEAAAHRWGVAPWYYEQLAIIYRKQGRLADEVAILERYDRQTKAPGILPAQMRTRLEKARSLAAKSKRV